MPVSSDPPRYPYLHVDVPSDQVELTSLWLFELGATGVEERDGTTFTRPDPESSCTLVGSYPDDATAQAALREVSEHFPARVTYVTDDSWRERWKAHFKPTKVGERLVVRPSWESYEAAPSDVVMVLDPGGAFGTGTHESTRLVMRLLEDCALTGIEFLDVGCGSGILTIAALLLGADRAIAIDVDDASVEATLENAERNGVEDRVEASKTPVDQIGREFPLVISNIEAHVLIPLAEQVAARVAPGGTLILSGILDFQGDDVEAAYRPLRCNRRAQEGEWLGMVFERAQDGR